ncbi:MAG: GIY-YIG nuclease family protein, partial [Acidimicrobiales bacterium]
MNLVELSAMWTRDRVISAYRKATKANTDIPLSQREFKKIVPETAWFRKYFARFSELVRAAGYEPGVKHVRHADEPLLEPMVELVRRFGRFPTSAERVMERRSNPAFPSNATLGDHFGDTDGLKAALRSFCARREDCDDILELLSGNPSAVDIEPSSIKARGSVYLMRYGRNYKIGRTNSVGRRHYEHGRAVPGEHRLIHHFETDDPEGIEA